MPSGPWQALHSAAKRAAQLARNDVEDAPDTMIPIVRQADDSERVIAEEAAPGVWFLAGSSHHSVGIAMKDYLVLVEAPLYERKEISGTEIRRRMGSGEKWEELVPKPVANIIRQIDGVERIKAIAEREMHDHH